MAKDGTARGGQRVSSGRKPKAAKVETALEIIENLKTDVELEGVDVPPVREYMKTKQKNGKEIYAEEIFKKTYLWLKKRGCENLVSQQLIENYAMTSARYIQCEEAINEYGFLAKHPTTGNAIASPYVQMSQTYLKQVNATWYQIY